MRVMVENVAECTQGKATVDTSERGYRECSELLARLRILIFPALSILVGCSSEVRGPVETGPRSTWGVIHEDIFTARCACVVRRRLSVHMTFRE